jgi:hypothetical protein
MILKYGITEDDIKRAEEADRGPKFDWDAFR